MVADLVSLGYGPDELARLSFSFTRQRLAAVLTWLISCFTIYSALAEIGEGSGRMAEIVKALKTYTYLDQAPVQNVNVYEGLDNTLVMLRSKLKEEVTIYSNLAVMLASFGQ